MERHVAVDDPARQVDRRRDAELGQHRRGLHEVVAVAVVERHADVAARARAAQQVERAIEADGLRAALGDARASARGSARARRRARRPAPRRCGGSRGCARRSTTGGFSRGRARRARWYERARRGRRAGGSGARFAASSRVDLLDAVDHRGERSSSCATSARPAAARRARSSGSRSASTIAAASAAGCSGGTIQPVSPGPHDVGRAADGRGDDGASRARAPRARRRAGPRGATGSTTRSAQRDGGGGAVREAREVHRVRDPELGGARDQRLVVGAAADEQRARPRAAAARTCGKASTRTSTPLTGKWRPTQTTSGRRSGSARAPAARAPRARAPRRRRRAARARSAAPGGDAARRRRRRRRPRSRGRASRAAERRPAAPRTPRCRAPSRAAGCAAAATATTSAERTDCACATSGRNSATSARIERNQSVNALAPGRSATRWSATPATSAAPKSVRRAVHDEHVVAAGDEPARVRERQPLTAAETESRGDEKNAHAASLWSRPGAFAVVAC